MTPTPGARAKRTTPMERMIFDLFDTVVDLVVCQKSSVAKRERFQRVGAVHDWDVQPARLAYVLVD